MESLKSRQYGSTSGLRLRFEGIDGDWRCDMPWLYCSEYILVQWQSYQKSKLNKGRVWDSKVIDILTSRYDSIGLTRSTAQSNLWQSSFHPSCKPVVRQPLMLSLQLACVQKRHCKLTMLHPQSVFAHFCKLQSLAQQTLTCRQVVGGACGHLGKRRKPWAGAADLGRRHRRTYSMPSCQIAWVCKIEMVCSLRPAFRSVQSLHSVMMFDTFNDARKTFAYLCHASDFQDVRIAPVTSGCRRPFGWCPAATVGGNGTNLDFEWFQNI